MDELPSLNERYAKAIMLFLLDHPEGVMQKDLFHIVKNSATREKVLRSLESDGLIEITARVVGRKTYNIRLTEKGRLAAEKLREVEEVAKMDPAELEKFRNLHALQHFNMYEDHITITDISMEGVKYVNIYARPKGEILYFYCEDCGKDDCYHIGYLFFDSKLREFVKKWVEKNGYKLAPKYEKYVEKYW